MHIKKEVDTLCNPRVMSVFKGVMIQEEALSGHDWSYLHSVPQEIYGITRQLMEIADSCLIVRSYVPRYYMSNAQYAFASISAHTNIMMALLDRAIYFECDEHDTELVFGYSYRELIEAARRHDLPENVIGDIPDDGMVDKEEKLFEERKYWHEFSALSPPHQSEFEMHVLELLQQMGTCKSAAGRLLHLADKFSAIIEVLAYDMAGIPPIKEINDADVSREDRTSMNYCDYHDHGFCKASEMWTVSYLKQRKLTRLDTSGFLTAVMVMATLLARKGNWYSWRYDDYEKLR